MYLHIIGIIIIIIESIIIFQISYINTFKKLYLAILFIQLYMVSALRSIEIGNDTKNYFELYTNLANGIELNYYILRYEIGFLVYTKFLTFLSNNPIFLNIISTFIILSLVFVTIYRNTNYVWLAILLFINLRFFYMSLNILRQMIAVSLILYAVSYIYQAKFHKFLLTCLLASLFHVSAILLIPTYFLRNLKINKKNVFIFIAIAIMLFLLSQGIIQYIFKIFPRFEIYLHSVYFNNGIRIASIMNTAILLFLLLIFTIAYNNIKEITKDEEKKINILFYLFFIGVILSFVSISINLVDRFVVYFSIFSILLLPKLIELTKSRKLLVPLAFATVLITLFYNLAILYLRPEWNHLYPYKFFWQ